MTVCCVRVKMSSSPVLFVSPWNDRESPCANTSGRGKWAEKKGVKIPALAVHMGFIPECDDIKELSAGLCYYV